MLLGDEVGEPSSQQQDRRSICSEVLLQPMRTCRDPLHRDDVLPEPRHLEAQQRFHSIRALE